MGRKVLWTVFLYGLTLGGQYDWRLKTICALIILSSQSLPYAITVFLTLVNIKRSGNRIGFAIICYLTTLIWSLPRVRPILGDCREGYLKRPVQFPKMGRTLYHGYDDFLKFSTHVGQKPSLHCTNIGAIWLTDNCN
jgi:hypothetical protein